MDSVRHQKLKITASIVAIKSVGQGDPQYIRYLALAHLTYENVGTYVLKKVSLGGEFTISLIGEGILAWTAHEEDPMKFEALDVPVGGKGEVYPSFVLTGDRLKPQSQLLQTVLNLRATYVYEGYPTEGVNVTAIGTFHTLQDM